MIRLAAPTFLPDDRARIDDVLASGQLVQGRFVAEFEERVAGFLGHDVVALACSSGTAALHLAVLALELPPGREVIVPAFTWPSTAHVIVQAGLVPVFVDIDPDTLNLDPAGLERARSPRTGAVLPVHLFGIPAPMDATMAFAETWGLGVIEDAACALGTATDRGPAGTVGSIACFSLHPRKIITTGEGGLLTTRDPELAERLRRYRNHGMVRTDEGIVFEAPGLNYRLTELQGALGIGQMDQLDAILATRRRLGNAYLEAIDRELPFLGVPAGLRDPGNTFQSFTVRVPAEQRTAWMQRLRDAGVETTIGTYAVTSQPWYARSQGIRASDFPEAVRAQRELMTLPLHHGMSLDDVATVVDALRALPDSPAPEPNA